MNIPRHVLIIPDGNRRWARARKKFPHLGHLEGARISGKVLEEALNLGIPAVTIWGASVNNITRRSSMEVSFLFQVFKTYFTKLLKSQDVKKHDVRIRVLGRWKELLPKPVCAVIQKCIDSTTTHTGRSFTILLAYNGKDEMRDTIMRIAAEQREHPRMKIDDENIKKHLWTKDLPPVDLVIRTGGEPHLSTGVMMWDIAEARLYFTETLWPDFSPEEFKKAIEEYARMEKREGA